MNDVARANQGPDCGYPPIRAHICSASAEKWSVVVRQRVKLPHRARREFSNRWRPREGSQNGANNLLPAGARTGWPGAPIV
jgi:hypothetical protein